MHPQLAALSARYEGAQRRLQVLADRCSDAQWATRHQPKRWSPAECVVHLNLISASCLALIDAGLDAAAELPPMMAERYSRDPLGWLVSVMNGPRGQSGRLRLGAIRTSAAFQPQGDLTRSTVLADFARLQGLLIAAVHESDDLRIDRVMVRSPFDARLRYSLYSLLCILPHHQLRHVVQAERVWPD